MRTFIQVIKYQPTIYQTPSLGRCLFIMKVTEGASNSHIIFVTYLKYNGVCGTPLPDTDRRAVSCPSHQ